MWSGTLRPGRAGRIRTGVQKYNDQIRRKQEQTVNRLSAVERGKGFLYIIRQHNVVLVVSESPGTLLFPLSERTKTLRIVHPYEPR